MSVCKDKQEQLLLLYYEELEPPTQKNLRQHLESCSGCQAYYAGLGKLGSVIPREKPANVDDATLSVLRNNIQREIMSGRRSQESFFRQFFYPAPVLRLAMAALLFVVGFFVGQRQMAAPQPAFPVANLLTAAQTINTANSAISPVLANINRVNFDPASGEVDIQYTTVNQIQMSGNMSNPEIRRLLREALLEEDNPAVRLHAVKAVGRLTEDPAAVPGPEIVDALTFLVDKEQNPGVRLKAMQVFRKLLPDPLVKAVILNILMNEKNVSLRREALKALISQPLGEDDINILKRVARQDSNAYIKMTAREAIRDLPQPSIPGSGFSDPANSGEQGVKQ